VSVIDTATNTVVASVVVGTDPIGVATSPDGTLVYAANSNDTVSVIDTATNTVVHTFAVDPKPETGVHYIAVGPDGTLYVTDTKDKMLRVVTTTAPAVT
jgi:YVTN family beta-propeller protein